MTSYCTVREWMAKEAEGYIRSNIESLVAEWKAYMVSEMKKGESGKDAVRYCSFTRFLEVVDPGYERVTAGVFQEIDEGLYDGDKEAQAALFAPESAKDLTEILDEMYADPEFLNDYKTYDEKGRFKYWGRVVTEYYGSWALWPVAYRLEKEGVLPTGKTVYEEALKEAEGEQAA